MGGGGERLGVPLEKFQLEFWLAGPGKAVFSGLEFPEKELGTKYSRSISLVSDFTKKGVDSGTKFPRKAALLGPDFPGKLFFLVPKFPGELLFLVSNLL